MSTLQQRTNELIAALQGSAVERERAIEEIGALLDLVPGEARELLKEGREAYLIERLRLLDSSGVKRSREELVQLIDKIMRGEGGIAEIDEWLRIIEANVPGAPITDLIFYPDHPNPTAEQILDQALAYRPTVHHL